MLILSEDDLRRALAHTEAIPAIEGAFRALAEGRAVLPGVISLSVPGKNGEYHVKGAYLAGSRYVVFKSAVSYYDNPARGLPSSGGFFVAFDAGTGALEALMLDNGFLTHARTGAAGAVAAKYLAKKKLKQAAILGCGTQARYQFEYLRKVRKLARVALWDRDRESAEKFRWEIEEVSDIQVTVAADARAAVEASDCVVTVTPSRKPIVMAAWVRPGTHITAVGADDPAKQELDEEIFAKADLIVADRLAQCIERGDIRHAIEKRVIFAKDVSGELGDLVTGRIRGRTSDRQITVCDLTGVGVQDAAIANIVLAKAIEMRLGKEISA